MSKYLSVIRALTLCCVSTLCVSPVWSQSTFPADTPYTPNLEVREAVALLGTWAEVYEVPSEELARVVRALEIDHVAPAALGVVLPDGLHAQIKGKALLLKAKKFEALRAGAPVAYDQDCRIVPEAQDNFKFYFANSGNLKNVVLDATILETYSFSKVAWLEEGAALQRVARSTEANCKSLDERRALLRGTLRWTVAGKEHVIPVLMQTVQMKPASSP